MKSFKSILLGLLAGVGIAVAAHAQNISIATGGTGGVYYPMGGGLAAALSKYVPGMQATAEVTGGSVDNLKLIGSGKPYVAFSMSDAALDAYQGEDKFKGNKVPVRTLAVLYLNRMRGERGGQGRRQAVRPEGQARVDRLARQRHRGDGLRHHRSRRHGQGQGPEARAPRCRRVRQRAQGRQDRRLLLGRRPADGGRVSDLANTPGTKIKMIDHAEVVPAMNKKYGNLYVQDSIGKDVYKGMDADNKQATVMNILVAHQNMDDKTAYNIVKTIFEKKDDLVAVHKEAENFKLENQKQDATPSRSTPARWKYFAEKGVKVN